MAAFLSGRKIRNFCLAILCGAFALGSWAVELKSGDVLLQPLNCWSCSLIEEEEGSNYAHSAIYVELESGKYVFEAIGRVGFTPFDVFMKRTKAGQRVRVMRFKEIRFSKSELLQSLSKFAGLSFDSDFLWDNYDEFGEKLYCSELVYKIFYPFYGEALPLKKMTYNENREYWLAYFGGKIPDNQLGNAPEDFHQSDLLEAVGDL